MEFEWDWISVWNRTTRFCVSIKEVQMVSIEREWSDRKNDQIFILIMNIELMMKSVIMVELFMLDVQAQVQSALRGD